MNISYTKQSVKVSPHTPSGDGHITYMEKIHHNLSNRHDIILATPTEKQKIFINHSGLYSEDPYANMKCTSSLLPQPHVVVVRDVSDQALLSLWTHRTRKTDNNHFTSEAILRATLTKRGYYLTPEDKWIKKPRY